MALTSSNRCSSLRTMPILDDDVIRMCPSNLVRWDNRGTKGIILGQLVLREPVSDYYRHPPAYQKPQKGVTWRHSYPVCIWLRRIRYVRNNWGLFPFAKTTGPRMWVISRTAKKAYWLCIHRISRSENCLARVTGLIYSQERIVLEVILGTASSNVIGWKSACRHRSRTLACSAKPWGNIPRRVKSQCYVWSNQSGFFYNASPRIQGTNLREWRKWFGKSFASYFLQKDKIPLTHHRISKYDAVQ